MCTVKKCRRCGRTDEEWWISIKYEGDLCSACYRPHDKAPRPRSRKYKPNDKHQQLKYRFPDHYWPRETCDGFVFGMMDESSRYITTCFSISRKQKIKILMARAKSNEYFDDLPF